MENKVLVVGGGSIGKRHIRNLLHINFNSDDIHCVEPREDRVEELNKLGIKDTYESLNEALKKNNYTFSILCSPTIFHIDQAISLAREKINIFIEKPLSADLNKIDELLAQVEKNKIRVGIAYVFRFSPLVGKVKEILNTNLLGKLLYFRGEFSEYLPDFHPYEDYRTFYMAKKELGGGSILDQSHIIDLAYYLLGDFKSVFAFNSKVSNLEINTDDIAEMLIETKNGVVGTIHTDIIGRNHKKELEIKGELGNITINFYENSVNFYSASDKNTIIYNKFEKDFNQNYILELKNFIMYCQGKEEIKTSLSDSIKIMKLIFAAQKSYKTGQREGL